jgi:hypothetical protein
MVKVSIQVSNGTARFSVAVRAESIQRAVSLVGGRYPGRDVRVKFPIEPEGFFVEASAAPAGIVEIERPAKKRHCEASNRAKGGAIA